MNLSAEPRFTPNAYSYLSLRGRYFAFFVNKLLDCHYTLLFDAGRGDSRPLQAFHSLYRQLTLGDLDFNLLWEKVRYSLTSDTRDQLLDGMRRTFEEIASDFADNLLRAFPTYEVSVFPEHRPQLDSTCAFMRSSFIPKETLLYDHLKESLQYEFSPPMPVYFVGAGTTKGGFTSEPSLTVINVTGLESTEVAELVLHEVVHGAEHLNQTRLESAPSVLASELAKVQKDANFAAAWHALIFWNAGELARRFLDPAHVHYGDRYGVYRRAFSRERELYSHYWNAHLDGKMSMREALAKVAEHL